MADAHPDRPADQAPASDRRRPPGMPRWVKVSLIVGAVVVLLFVIGRLTGIGGDHGPSRHGGHRAPSEVTRDGGHQPPVDHAP